MPLNTALIFDDPTKDHLLEVGVVRWSITHRATVASRSWLVRAPENPAEAVNGIPAALVAAAEHDAATARLAFEQCAASADVLIAHNADFDVQWLDVHRPVIDSAWDLAWPRAAGGRKLHELALGHGLAVLDAHRALPDCQLLARLLERVGELGHDVEALLERALRPKIKVISEAPFEQKELVKSHGFRWNPEARVWWRNMAAEDVPALPLRCHADQPAARRPRPR